MAWRRCRDLNDGCCDATRCAPPLRSALLAAWIPAYTARRPLSLPILLVVTRAVIFWLPVGLDTPDPLPAAVRRIVCVGAALLMVSAAGCSGSGDSDSPSTTADCVEGSYNLPPGAGDTVPIQAPPMNSIPDAEVSTELACR